MQNPADRKYTKTHEWIQEDSGEFTIGITDFAQHALGDIVFVELPQVGQKVKAGESFVVIESVKAVSGAYAPVAGEVIKVNEDLENEPQLMNEDAFGTWIVVVKATEQASDLLDAEAYTQFAEKEGN